MGRGPMGGEEEGIDQWGGKRKTANLERGREGQWGAGTSDRGGVVRLEEGGEGGWGFRGHKFWSVRLWEWNGNGQSWTGLAVS
jgi:hypothetical protein